MKKIVLAAFAASLVAFGTVPARAGEIADHLKCYKAKDPQPKATYSADIVDDFAGTASGCTIKVPAKMLCNFVQKTNVSPTPPGLNRVGQNFFGQLFACYKLKCPKTSPSPISIGDQFANRSATLKKGNLICAPANVPVT